MKMIDKINNLLTELDNPEVFDSFVSDYHKFVDNSSQVDHEIFLQVDSFKPVNSIKFDNLEKLSKSLENLRKVLNKTMNSIEVDINKLNNFSEVDNPEEFDNDYPSENLVKFKMKINADQIRCTTLNDAA